MPIPKLKQPKPKQQRLQWSPSENIKRQISVWEGDAMHKSTIDPLTGKMVSKNVSFEDVAKDFIQSIPVDIRDQVLSNQDLADYLYSFRYNVKPDTFRSRVIPVLSKYYAGQASVDDLVGSIWASGDKTLRGLQNRRSVERNGIRRALIGDLVGIPNEFERTAAEIPSYQRPQFNAPVLKIPAVNTQYNKQPHQGVSPYIDRNTYPEPNPIQPWEYINQNQRMFRQKMLNNIQELMK